jgi:hypothetical protein
VVDDAASGSSRSSRALNLPSRVPRGSTASSGDVGGGGFDAGVDSRWFGVRSNNSSVVSAEGEKSEASSHYSFYLGDLEAQRSLNLEFDLDLTRPPPALLAGANAIHKTTEVHVEIQDRDQLEKWMTVFSRVES